MKFSKKRSKGETKVVVTTAMAFYRSQVHPGRKASACEGRGIIQA
jgi:hypothetical protein